MKLLSTKFSPVFPYFILFWAKYSTQRPFLKHAASKFLPKYDTPYFISMKTRAQIIFPA